MSSALVDTARSERFGEQVLISSERQRMHREGIEHIDVFGHLRVPVDSSLDRAPKREGWEPYFVSINIKARPQKWFTYRRIAA